MILYVLALSQQLQGLNCQEKPCTMPNGLSTIDNKLRRSLYKNNIKTTTPSLLLDGVYNLGDNSVRKYLVIEFPHYELLRIILNRLPKPNVSQRFNIITSTSHFT